jgi:hypothetical protein
MTRPFASLAVAATLAACATTPKSDERPSVADLAVDVLAADLGIVRERIAVQSVTPMDWRDSSLGCPRPDMAYLDVITPGHKVILSVDGEIHAVHEANGRAFVCDQPRLPGRMAAAGFAYERQMLTARKDLASRLGVPVHEILPDGAEQRIWNDASLGCPEPGMQYAQVVTEGWVLTLRHGERDYTYHADAHHTKPCPAIEAR